MVSNNIFESFEGFKEKKAEEYGYYKIIVADDDDEVHKVTKYALSELMYKKKKLKFFNAYNEEETIKVLRENPDASVILLDIIMDKEDSGLRLVETIRNELNNKKIRIILRTGQPGIAPEQEIIENYEINDYKTKEELIERKLLTSVISSLRSYDDLQELENNKIGLEKILESSNIILKEKKLAMFMYKVLKQLEEFFALTSEQKVAIEGGIVLDIRNRLIINGMGKFRGFSGKYNEKTFPNNIFEKFKKIAGNNIFIEENTILLPYKSLDGETYVMYIEGRNFQLIKDHTNTQLKMFFKNISLAFNNLSLHKELEKKLNEIEFMAKHDFLTKLPNRAYFIEICNLRLAGKLPDQDATLIWLGIDNFKEINEMFGEKTGDEILKHFSCLLKKAFLPNFSKINQKIDVINVIESQLYLYKNCGRERWEDGNTIVSHVGGDEFAILITEAQENMLKYLEKLNKLEFHYIHENSRIELKFSAGISKYEEGKKVEDLINEVKISLEKAKKSGGDRIYEYSKKLMKDLESELDLESRMKRAFSEKEFKLYYQPKIRLIDDKLVGAEALIRWNDGERGLISPGEFIPIAEKTGLISKIGDFVLEEGMKKLSEWQKKGVDIRLSVNLSPIQLMDKKFLIRVNKLILKSLVDPNYLEFEITENTLVDNIARSIEMLDSVKNMGIKLSIDDFGTGYSSLSYLKKLSVDTLKIDKSFVDEITKDADSRHIINAIITMGKILQLKIIAEGVETIEQLEILKGLGCDEVQGYYYSKPLPEEEFEKKYFEKKE